MINVAFSQLRFKHYYVEKNPRHLMTDMGDTMTLKYRVEDYFDIVPAKKRRFKKGGIYQIRNTGIDFEPKKEIVITGKREKLIYINNGCCKDTYINFHCEGIDFIMEVSLYASSSYVRDVQGKLRNVVNEPNIFVILYSVEEEQKFKILEEQSRIYWDGVIE